MGPASVTRLESRRSIVPSSALLLLSGNFFSSARPSTSYMHTYLPFPPASSSAPSAEYASVLNDLLALAVALRKSPITLPPAMSRLPSIVPCNCASLGFQRNTWPSRVLTATCFPSGRNATARTSCACGRISVWPLPSYTSQRRTDLSHDPEARSADSGEKERDVTGPWWPERMSSMRPVFMDQM